MILGQEIHSYHDTFKSRVFCPSGAIGVLGTNRFCKNFFLPGMLRTREKYAFAGGIEVTSFSRDTLKSDVKIFSVFFSVLLRQLKDLSLR